MAYLTAHNIILCGSWACHFFRAKRAMRLVVPRGRILANVVFPTPRLHLGR